MTETSSMTKAEMKTRLSKFVNSVSSTANLKELNVAKLSFFLAEACGETLTGAPAEKKADLVERASKYV